MGSFEDFDATVRVDNMPQARVFEEFFGIPGPVLQPGDVFHALKSAVMVHDDSPEPDPARYPEEALGVEYLPD